MLLAAEAEQVDLLNRACFGELITTATKDKLIGLGGGAHGSMLQSLIAYLLGL